MSFITPGIKYIKVSKFDSEGRDNTISLREITDLRLNTTDNGFINYPIVTRTEYEDYFLLQTVTTNTTSSTNNQILDYQVSASNTGPISDSFGILFPASDIGTKVINFTENIDILNYFNPVSGNYILDNTPNIPLIYTASCNYVYDGPPGQNSLVYLNFVQGDSSLGRIQITSGSGLNGTMLISGSFTPVENQIYSLYIGTSGETMNFTNIDFKITQSHPPTAGIGSQVIMEPYLPIPFTNSDYNAIINNIITSRPNNKFFNVDFLSNQIIAVNGISIISASRGIGFATPSTVPQSNYTTKRITSPRYIGKELTSAEFNKYTEGDISYGAEPVINLYDSCIYEFDWGGGGYPEYVNGGTLSLGNILLVDSLNNVNVISPSNPIYTQILESNLKNGTTIYPQTYAPGGNLGAELSVVYQGVEIPSIPSFYAPSGSGGNRAQLNYNSGIVFLSGSFFGSTLDSNGFITTSSLTFAQVNISINISSSLLQGNRWFISVYKNLGNTASGSLLQGTGSILIPPIEIFGTDFPNSNTTLFLSKEFDFSPLTGSVIGQDLGALIWSSPAGSTRIIVSGSNSSAFSGVGQGAFTTQYPKPIIPENFQSITKTYGSNKT